MPCEWEQMISWMMSGGSVGSIVIVADSRTGQIHVTESVVGGMVQMSCAERVRDWVDRMIGW